jgi:VWFA-related protein
LDEIAERVFREAPREEVRGRRAVVALTDGVDSTSVADFEQVREKLEERGLIAYFIAVDTRNYFEEQLLGDCQLAMRFSAAQIRRYYRSIGGKVAEKATSFCELGDFERLAVSKQLYAIADNEMNALAKASGGRVFPVGDLSEARAAFKSVADEIGTQYTLGYYPSNEKRDGRARRIRVELKGLPAGSKVRYRESYTPRFD